MKANERERLSERERMSKRKREGERRRISKEFHIHNFGIQASVVQTISFGHRPNH